MRVANTQVKHLVEASGSQKSLVEQIWSVCGANDKNATTAVFAITHAIQLSKQLRYDTIHDSATVALVATLRCNRVQFVEENNARSCIPGTLEHSSHIGFRLTNVHVEQLWSLH